jgi:hypothetical protein
VAVSLMKSVYRGSACPNKRVGAAPSAFGRGEDAAKFDDKERTRLRKQALGDGTETGTQLVFDSDPWKFDLAPNQA